MAASGTQASPLVDDAAMVTELHDAHGPALYDFARHLGLSDEQAADALQEAILRCGASSSVARSSSALPLGLYRTVYRLAMEHIAASSAFATSSPTRATSHRLRPGRKFRPSDRLGACDGLPPRQRHVLYLHDGTSTDSDLRADRGRRRHLAQRDPHPRQPRIATLRERHRIEESRMDQQPSSAPCARATLRDQVRPSSLALDAHRSCASVSGPAVADHRGDGTAAASGMLAGLAALGAFRTMLAGLQRVDSLRTVRLRPSRSAGWVERDSTSFGG